MTDNNMTLLFTHRHTHTHTVLSGREQAEMFIAHMLPLSCNRKKLQTLSHLNCGLQIHQIWIQLITTCGKYCKGGCTKHISLICSYQRRHWRMAAAMMTWSSLAHSILSRCFSPSKSVICILYTFFLAIDHTCCNQLDLNLANLEATVEMG